MKILSYIGLPPILPQTEHLLHGFFHWYPRQLKLVDSSTLKKKSCNQTPLLHRNSIIKIKHFNNVIRPKKNVVFPEKKIRVGRSEINFIF
jgi:hypothetical protein